MIRPWSCEKRYCSLATRIVQERWRYFKSGICQIKSSTKKCAILFMSNAMVVIIGCRLLCKILAVRLFNLCGQDVKNGAEYPRNTVQYLALNAITKKRVLRFPQQQKPSKRAFVVAWSLVAQC